MGICIKEYNSVVFEQPHHEFLLELAWSDIETVKDP